MSATLTAKQLITNYHQICRQFDISNPFITLAYKYALSYKASSLNSSMLQQAYDQCWQQIVQGITASVNINAHSFPSFVLMPLNNQTFPKVDAKKEIFNGVVRVVGEKLSEPFEMQCMNSLQEYVQLING